MNKIKINQLEWWECESSECSQDREKEKESKQANSAWPLNMYDNNINALTLSQSQSQLNRQPDAKPK